MTIQSRACLPVTLVIALLAAACSGDAGGVTDATRAALAATGAGSSARQLPVTQSSSGRLWPIGLCDAGAGIPLMRVEGTGTATHVGRFYIEKTMCLNPATGAVTNGVATLRAANGDQIRMLFQGQAQAGVEPPTINFVYAIVGGSGRFVRASGELDIRTVLTSSSTWTSSGSGWMSYEGSDRNEH